jgi:hypothetical protein
MKEGRLDILLGWIECLVCKNIGNEWIESLVGKSMSKH